MAGEPHELYVQDGMIWLRPTSAAFLDAGDIPARSQTKYPATAEGWQEAIGYYQRTGWEIGSSSGQGDALRIALRPGG